MPNSNPETLPDLARATRARPATGPIIMALILREMATTYGRSPGGYIWAVLEPVAGIALLTFVFTLAFSAPPLGQSFPMFYATGFLIYAAYLNLSNKLTVAIRFSKPLLFYPAVRFTDPLMARFVLNALTECVVAAVVLTGIVLIFALEPTFDYLTLTIALGLTLLLGLAVGTLNCALVSLFPVWERVWAIANRPLFIVSTIFFVFESVPQPYRDLLWFNPLVHVVGLARRAVYPAYDASYVSIPFVAGVAGTTCLIGLILLSRWYREIINN